MPKKHTSLSKFLSFILRHEPAAIGLTLDENGWVSVEELLHALANHGKPLPRTDLERALQRVTSAAKRFAELGLGVAIVNDFCSPPRGTVRRPLSGLPSVRYQLLRLRDRQQSPAALALEAAIIASTHPSKTQ